jgi:hypothetical protein
MSLSVPCTSISIRTGILTGLCGSSVALGVGGDPVDAGNDTGVGAGAIVSEDLDGNDGGLLCDSVCGAGNGSSDVGSVAIGISVAGSRDGVVAPDGAAAKVVVGGQDTGVDDVGIDAGACAAVVDVVGAGAGLVRDGAKTPRGDGGLGGLFAGLATGQIFIYIYSGLISGTYNGTGNDDRVGLDVGHLGAGGNLVDGLLVKGAGVALQASQSVGVVKGLGAGLESTLLHGRSVDARSPAGVGLEGGIRDTLVEDDNVRVWDNVASLGRRGDGAAKDGEDREGRKGEVREKLHCEGWNTE